MAILIGIAAAVAVLYVWLAGHWFGRVLMFLLLAVGFGLLGASAGANVQFGQTQPVAAVYEAPRPKGPPVSEGQAIADAYRALPESNTPALAPIPSPALEIIGALIGIALAWPISSIPIYYKRNQLRILRGRRSA